MERGGVLSLGVQSQIPNPQSTLTGVFYHPSFSRRSYLTVGRRLADFPQALEALLGRPSVTLFECPGASDDLIRLVHDPGLIPEVEADPL
jgi:hypothetical protein